LRAKPSMLLLLSLLVLLGAQPRPWLEEGWAWGTVEHQILAVQAIELLPEPWKPLLKFYDWLIAKASVYPDTTYLDREGRVEQQRHYIDLEIWSPKDPATGTLPFAVEQFFHQLVESIRGGDWDRALVLLGRISHYIADIHQPYHSTKNYWPVTADGEALHSTVDRWLRNNREKVVFVTTYPLTPIENLTSFVFSIAWQSHSYLPKLNNTLLDRGRNHTRGVGWTPELDAIMVNRTNTAVISIARVWYTALLRAAVNPPTPPANTPLRVTISRVTPAQEGPLDPDVRYDFRVEVRDALGVRIDSEVRAAIDGIPLMVFPAPGEPEPHGRYQVTILPGQLKPLQGRTSTLSVTASARGYTTASTEMRLDIRGATVEVGQPPIPGYTLYIGLAAAVAALIITVMALRIRRGG
jgi:hypothetical protein